MLVPSEDWGADDKELLKFCETVLMTLPTREDDNPAKNDQMNNDEEVETDSMDESESGDADKIDHE